MIALNIPLTAISLFMVAVMLFTTSRLGRLSAKYFMQQQNDLGKVNGYIEEMMEGQKVVKVFCHEEKSIERGYLPIAQMPKKAGHLPAECSPG